MVGSDESTELMMKFFRIRKHRAQDQVGPDCDHILRHLRYADLPDVGQPGTNIKKLFWILQPTAAFVKYLKFYPEH